MRRDGLFPNNAVSEEKHQGNSQVKLPALGPPAQFHILLVLQPRPPGEASLRIPPHQF